MRGQEDRNSTNNTLVIIGEILQGIKWLIKNTFSGEKIYYIAIFPGQAEEEWGGGVGGGVFCNEQAISGTWQCTRTYHFFARFYICDCHNCSPLLMRLVQVYTFGRQEGK